MTLALFVLLKILEDSVTAYQVCKPDMVSLLSLKCDCAWKLTDMTSESKNKGNQETNLIRRTLLHLQIPS